MKHEKSYAPTFIPYDDENLEHVMAGPDYGQPNSSSNAWTELDSKEYPDFVEEISFKIIKHPVLKIPVA
jgi:hypothetical protein